MGDARPNRDVLAGFVTEYAEQTADAAEAQAARAESAPVQADAERVNGSADADAFPDSFSDLSDDDLEGYAERARSEFAELYGDGNGTYTAEDVARLKELREVALSVKAEREARSNAAEPAELPADLGEFASEMLSDASAEDANGEFAKKAVAVAKDDSEDDEDDADPQDDDADADDSDADGEDDEDSDSEDDSDDEDTPKKKDKSMTASATGRGRTLARRNATPAAKAPEKTMKDVVFATGEKATPGTGIDWNGIGEAIAGNLRSFPASQYANASRAGRHLRQQFGVAAFNKPTDASLTIDSNDPMHVDSVLRHAMDERRTPQGSLVASGGWCAPSETIYDLCELESNDGLVSLPEVTVKRGGLQRTLGPSFADIFNDTGFAYTEAEDQAGNYDGNGGGTKPCYHVECADFENFRLQVAGLCLTAGLLQQQGYPELIARTARGALVAHNHKMNARYIESIENGSTPVVYPNVPGATAPLLAAIEKQAQHIRYSNRMATNATIEAVFPLWVYGVVREDLSQRQGTDLDPFNVTDQMINGWFSARGISPQFVYDWQDINLISAGQFVAYPNEVKFLMYPAGTWVKGGSNVITLDTLYDSRLLGTNDYTALWSEESWMVVKMCQDSRVVTVPLCPNGVTNSGQVIECQDVTLGAETTPAIGNGEGTTTTTTTSGTTTTTTTAKA